MIVTDEMVRAAGDAIEHALFIAPAVDLDEVARAALTAALAAMWKPTHRHKKRGGEYSVIGKAQVQCEDGLTDYEIVTVYRDAEGELWVRRKSEFNDGRFEELRPT